MFTSFAKPVGAAVVAIGLAATTGAAAAADLTIGVANWPSARASAHLLGAVIENRLGLDVAYAEGTPPQIFARMDAGEIDLFPEVWLPNHRGLLAEYGERRGAVEIVSRGIPAEQGLCATRYTAEVAGIRSVFDLAKPEKVEALDSNADAKGEMWIGAPGWEATRIERVRARSYGYADTMQLLAIDERTAMAAVDVAVAVERPIVFYCYEPHHVFALHDVVRLEEPPHDPTTWNMRPESEPDWLESSEAGSAYGLSFIHVGYAPSLAEAHPEVIALAERLDLDADVLSAMSYALVVERQAPDVFADEWVAANAERVDRWVE